jgi:hypothetical protein
MDIKLNQNIIFVKNYELYDFSKNMGQLAVMLEYTSGDKQMLSSSTPKFFIGN